MFWCWSMLVPPVGWTVNTLFHLVLAALEGYGASKSSREGERKQSDELHGQYTTQASAHEDISISCTFVLTYNEIGRLTRPMAYVFNGSIDVAGRALSFQCPTELADHASLYTRVDGPEKYHVSRTMFSQLIWSPIIRTAICASPP